MEPLLEQLFRLRLVVARHGEMDRARWWNANGVLGTRGETVLRRGFPRTAPLARARVAFTVAHARCAEAVGLSDAITLWRLPPTVEDRFDAAWRAWSQDPEPWRRFVDEVDRLDRGDLVASLSQLGVVAEPAALVTSRLRVGREDRGIFLGECEVVDGDILSRLAAAFSLGKAGHLIVPYMRTVRPADA